MRKPSPVSLCLSLIALFYLLPCSFGKDRISGTEVLRDGESLESPNGQFVLGFFSPGNPTARYLGIWYSFSPATVVWVVNRRNPINDASGFLSFNNKSQLVLSSSNQTIWSPESKIFDNQTARLLDDGNFVLQARDNPDYLWQSFDFPTDTLLPGMKLGPDFINNGDRNLTSWESESDPSPGEYTCKMDNGETGEQYLTRNGSEIVFRSGPWNGIEFSGYHRMRSFQDLTFTVVFNSNESYYQYWVKEPSTLARLVVEPLGRLRLYGWDEETREWRCRWSAPDESVCDGYELCGPNAVCDSGSIIPCSCLEGFQALVSAAGCQSNRTTWRRCQSDDGDDFLRKSSMKLPDTSNAVVNRNASFDGCEDSCLSNCSCAAFAPANIQGRESGCILWYGDLVDLRSYSAGGQDIYLRIGKGDLAKLAPEKAPEKTPENAPEKAPEKSRNSTPLIIGPVLGTTALILLVVTGFVFWKKKEKRVEKLKAPANEGSRIPEGFIDDEIDLPLFGLDAILVTTNNFACDHKIGRGGFGEVYKGVLPGGEEIAVKRLSRSSCQGLIEFKNEVMVIAKLQHKNLVRLLGCCFQEDEKILVYEYMPNKSLDSLLFDLERKMLLDWRKRFNIIEGVARGLLYLHRDSRLKIVHRDLKAANILLDEEMNPKISDFGMARIFGGNQNQENTNRVVGTFGYMSPEYVMEGIFSEKSDVYSFGVVVLEIVSGRKNARACSENYFGLLGHAWELWAEGRPEDFIDPCIRESCDVHQAIRCIHIGLFCVQNIVKDRPTMSTVLIFLTSKNLVEGYLEQPTFFIDNNINDTFIRNLNEDHFSANEVSISVFTGR